MISTWLCEHYFHDITFKLINDELLFKRNNHQTLTTTTAIPSTITTSSKSLQRLDQSDKIGMHMNNVISLECQEDIQKINDFLLSNR
jgi:hypothetical protein